MDNGMALVLESVFGRREIDQVSIEEIRELIQEFPSFNAGHYFLSQKLKDGDAVAYAAATRQTALYFNNPLWLQHLLEEPDDSTAAAALPQTDDRYQYWPLIESAPVAEPADSIPAENHYSVNESFHSGQQEVTTLNEAIHSGAEETPTVNETFHSVQMETPTVNETVEETSASAPTLNEILQPVSDEALASADAANRPAADNEALLDETYGGVKQEPTDRSDTTPQPDPMYDDNPAFEWPAESTPDLTVAGLSEEPEPGTLPPGVAAGLAAAAAELIPGKPAEGAFDEKKAKAIVFEPYHTIDYFASQGIKLVLEDNPPDAFGRQLKSFTEWLKTMKRLPVQPLTGKADETETAEVKNFAAHSVEDRDILTETMAEVLVKQGMTENAIAIYAKLSLIYPLKSAYFAARIEQLKASGS